MLLVCGVAGLWLLRDRANRSVERAEVVAVAVTGPATKAGKASATSAVSPMTLLSATSFTNHSKDLLKYRLSNSGKGIGEMTSHQAKALILANALIDTAKGAKPMDIPANLKAGANNRNWVVQSKGPMDEQGFRRMAQSVGGELVANGYVPNDAWMVRLSRRSGAGIGLEQPGPDRAALPRTLLQTLPATIARSGGRRRQWRGDVTLRVLVFAGEENNAVNDLKTQGARIAGTSEQNRTGNNIDRASSGGQPTGGRGPSRWSEVCRGCGSSQGWPTT